MWPWPDGGPPDTKTFNYLTKLLCQSESAEQNILSCCCSSGAGASAGNNIVLDRSSLIPPKSEVCITYVGYHDIELRQMIMSRDELGGEIFVIFIMTLVLHHTIFQWTGLESQNTNTANKIVPHSLYSPGSCFSCQHDTRNKIGSRLVTIKKSPFKGFFQKMGNKLSCSCGPLKIKGYRFDDPWAANTRTRRNGHLLR